MPLPTIRTGVARAATSHAAATVRAAAALIAAALLVPAAAHAAATFGPLPGDATPLAQDAATPAVTAGSLSTTIPRAPWVALVRSPTATTPTVQVETFRQGRWEGVGQPAPLNVDTTAPAHGPAIAFAGPGRTVPWVAWYEANQVFDTPTHPTQVLAARFAASAAAPGGGRWAPEGQDRTGGVPALNLHTDRTAVDPALATGPPAAGADPLPWVAWRERDGTGDTGPFQLFVAHAVRNATAQQPCPQDSGTSVGVFCWLRDGLGRIAPDNPAATGPDPSLNVDPTRSAVSPDIAFAGGATPTPWVVWVETGASARRDLSTQDLLFAAHGHPDPVTKTTTWDVVGANTTAEMPLDTSAQYGAGPCTDKIAAELSCALNHDPTAPAAAPAIATGSLTPGAELEPWIAWQERLGPGPNHGIFVARLAGDRFELLNDGKPISTPGRDATLPAIAFSGRTPYVAWREQAAGVTRIAMAHFGGNPADPAYATDTDPAGGAFSAGAGADGPALATTCAPDPVTPASDLCPAGAAGTPFLVAGDASSPEQLFALAPNPVAPVTRAPTVITTNGGTLEAFVSPATAPQLVRFQYGRTTAYGATTRARRVGPAGVARVAAGISHFTPGTKIHYRAVGASDFGSVPGADKTFTTTAPPRRPPPLRVTIKLLDPKLRDLVRSRRLRVLVTMSRPGRIELVARTRTAGGRTVPIAHRAARLRRKGPTTLAPRLSPAARGILITVQSPRVTITVRGAANNGTKRTVTRTFLLR